MPSGARDWGGLFLNNWRNLGKGQERSGKMTAEGKTFYHCITLSLLKGDYSNIVNGTDLLLKYWGKVHDEFYSN